MYGRSRIHFVGIGGAGMSGIAEVMLNMGYPVSGSDLKNTEPIERIIRLGGRVCYGHSASNVEGAQVVIHSSAVAADNPELLAARAAGIPVITRAQMLAELMRMKYGVAVAGAHGKTTTTSMIASVLARGGLDPTIVVGGRLHALGSNARLGHGQFLVAEADESDGSFLELTPAVAVITNIDREHMDHYRDLEAVRAAFVHFANRVPFYGMVALCGDDPQIAAVMPAITKRMVVYGAAPKAEVRAEDIRLEGAGSRFRVNVKGTPMGVIDLRVPGRHNVLNALAAVAIGLELEVGFQHIAEGLASFRGVSRRFDLKGEEGGVRVVDDYAHHPTEIVATLSAAKPLGGRRLVIFQPHRYTRTRLLREEFGAAFGEADRVWVLDVYGAGEPPIEGISGRTVVESAARQGARHVEHAPDPEEAVAAVVAEARAGDVVLTLGAGDVGKLGDEILRRLRGAGVGAEAGR